MMKPLAVLAALACLSLPCQADISAEKIVLEAHDNGPRVCLVLRDMDNAGNDGYGPGPTHGMSVVTLYARRAGDEQWRRVRSWEERSGSAHEPYTREILTENSRVLRDLVDVPWEARVVVENPGSPADQKFFVPQYDTATR